VLDNCEHVIGVAAALAERVVSEAPQAHILATSREALRVEGEHVHLLYSLDCPPEDAGLTAVEALRYPAAQLFMERAAASGYGAVLSDIDAPFVARICRRLDGVALAIELAASRAGSLGIRETAELLDNRFGLLWHGRRTALPRHEKHVLADGACGRCETVSLLCQQMGSGGFLARDGDRTCSAWDSGQYALSDVHRNSRDEAVLRKCWSSRQTCCHGSSWADWEPSRICGRNRLSCQRASALMTGASLVVDGGWTAD
jgi:hypothetical protein